MRRVFVDTASVHVRKTWIELHHEYTDSFSCVTSFKVQSTKVSLLFVVALAQ